MLWICFFTYFDSDTVVAIVKLLSSTATAVSFSSQTPKQLVDREPKTRKLSLTSFLSVKRILGFGFHVFFSKKLRSWNVNPNLLFVPGFLLFILLPCSARRTPPAPTLLPDRNPWQKTYTPGMTARMFRVLRHSLNYIMTNLLELIYSFFFFWHTLEEEEEEGGGDEWMNE